ncbi:putative anti-sigma F factor antagonist [[Clostridium] methylpentosum DSM 5476]|uniref:Anti-sigma factor antagonist n=1 Tax=[Clostridium] methylpentosum DSM 5476 TaxID=537013 RepID=C0EHC2_9FIRM|nr:putative anti-sigma F factor antagonist [[Clostridium] methylpentosum DSM 5476]MDY3987877.1 STAS domain-containing protein [Massilioclostridium sp.]MEE1490674.1 STAS domain-containing protein [Massilioclostridium sp.]
MNVKTDLKDGVLTAYIMGEIDHHTAKDIREEIDHVAESALPTLLILDFTDVTFMDSSGIGLVMGRYKLMKEIGGETRVTNPSPHINKVMRLAGLDRLAVIGKSNSKGGKHND